ncbi:MAG: FG-GAP-like repeat-containing protein [Candidatus Acidiferrales bacterium]
MLAASLAAPLARAQAPTPATPPPAASATSAQALPPASAAATPRPPAPDARKAREAYDAGLRAEQALDWKSAYAALTEAAEYAPDNHEYQLRRYLDRFALVQQYTDRAERELIAGQPAAARDDLLQALELDPGYSIAQERLQQLEPSGAIAVPNSKTKLADLPHIQPKPGTRSFDFRGQTRDAYQQVAQQFGLVAQFDTDLHDRVVRLRLDPVDFQTAMKALGAATRTFWRPMDTHTFFVADDTQPKRRDFAPEIERTFILPDSITPDDMNQTVRLIREIAGVNRAELDAGSRRLTLRDTPEHVALAEALIGEIEQPRGEMLLEIDLLEVDRSLSEQLGITPPTSATVLTLSGTQINSLQQAAANGTLLQTIESIFSSLGLLYATGGASALLPSILAFGGGKSIFLATMPSATANFAETINQVRSAQRLILRAEDGQKVSFFSGARFPVSLASLSASPVSPSAIGVGSLTGLLPTADYDTGTAPVNVIAANFSANAGAFPDLAVANSTANTVSILLNNGDGTFATHVDYPAGTGPAAIAAADFNGDGKLDLAVADKTGNTISILLGNGDGTFNAATTLTDNGGPAAIAAGVFSNASNNEDLAVVNQTAGTVSIFLGNGDGTFGANTDYTVGTSPSAIYVGDFTGDGILDLAVTNQGSNTVSILLGNGDGTFRAKTDYATGAAPSGIAVGDFNLDGVKDLAISNQTDSTVSILLGNSNGTFQTQAVYPAGVDPTSIATADFNNDGHLDLVVADGSANQVSILLGAGDGTFQTPLTVGTGNQPASVVAEDFNDDGLPDVAVAAEDSNEVTVILNSTSILGQTTTPFVPYPSAEYINLGLNVHATPRFNDVNEVTLDLQFEISSLAGESINNIPVLSNRTIEQTVRLKENQTSIITGLVQASELGAIGGWPGLAQAGRAGALAGEQTTQNSNTDMLILITPREIHMAPRSQHSFYAGAGEPGAVGGVALPPAATNGPPAPGAVQTPNPPPTTTNPGAVTVPPSPGALSNPPLPGTPNTTTAPGNPGNPSGQ